MSLNPHRGPSVSFGRFVYVPAQHILMVDGRRAIGVQFKALELLEALLETPGQVVDRKTLIQRLWPAPLRVTNNSLNVQVLELRKVLGPGVVETAKGRGYYFAAQIGTPPECQAPPPAPAQTETAPVAATGKLKTNLPPVLPPMLGRVDELATLGATVDGNRLVTVVGAGGIGKTRLAQALLDSRRNRYPHGVCWVELGALTDAGGLPGAVAGALGIQSGGGEPAGALCKALASLELLVALDNAEHLLDGLAVLLPQLLAAAPGLRLLVTSQAPLRLPIERVMTLDALAVPSGPMPAAEALSYGAVALFVDRAQAFGARFTLSDDDVPTVSALCRALDGLPLAIELAAARFGSLGLSQLLAAMGHRLRLLTNGHRAAPPRQQTLRAALNWTHGLLPPREQTVFRRLGVIAGSATLEVIQRLVADGEELPDARLDAWEGLNALIELSLVAVSQAGASQAQRYRLLESPRAYALERLEEAGELERVQRRHTAAMAEHFDTCWHEVFSGRIGMDALYASVEPDFDNAREAWHAALAAGDTTSALRIAAGLLLFLPESRIDESKQLADSCEAMLRSTPAPAPMLAFRVWFSVAYVRRISAPNRLRQPADQALRLASQLDDPSADRLPLFLARCMAAMADAIERDGIAAQAAIDDLQRIVDPRWPAQRRAVLAATEELHARRCTRDTRARLRLCRHWIDLDLERGFYNSTAVVNLIDCELAAGNAEAAVQAGRRALAALRGTRNELGLAHARLHLAAALLDLDRVDEALPVCREGWAQAVRFDMQAPWADLLAELAARQGRTEAAVRLLGFAEAGYRRHEGREYTHVKSMERTLALAQERLGGDALQNLHLAGEELVDADVAALAFGGTPANPTAR